MFGSGYEPVAALSTSAQFGENAVDDGILAATKRHLPMFDFGTASFSISRGRGCSAGDIGLERFGALARAELCAEEGGALIVWTGAGDVDVLASGSVTARACPGGARWASGRRGGGGCRKGPDLRRLRGRRMLDRATRWIFRRMHGQLGVARRRRSFIGVARGQRTARISIGRSALVATRMDVAFRRAIAAEIALFHRLVRPWNGESLIGPSVSKSGADRPRSQYFPFIRIDDEFSPSDRRASTPEATIRSPWSCSGPTRRYPCRANIAATSLREMPGSGSDSGSAPMIG